MPVPVRCEAKEGEGRCPDDATILRRVRGDHNALCNRHRLLLNCLLILTYQDWWDLYHRIWADGK